jgi:hypothetical protein
MQQPTASQVHLAQAILSETNVSDALRSLATQIITTALNTPNWTGETATMTGYPAKDKSLQTHPNFKSYDPRIEKDALAALGGVSSRYSKPDKQESSLPCVSEGGDELIFRNRESDSVITLSNFNIGAQRGVFSGIECFYATKDSISNKLVRDWKKVYPKEVPPWATHIWVNRKS